MNRLMRRTIKTYNLQREVDTNISEGLSVVKVVIMTK